MLQIFLLWKRKIIILFSWVNEFVILFYSNKFVFHFVYYLIFPAPIFHIFGSQCEGASFHLSVVVESFNGYNDRYIEVTFLKNNFNCTIYLNGFKVWLIKIYYEYRGIMNSCSLLTYVCQWFIFQFICYRIVLINLATSFRIWL